MASSLAAAPTQLTWDVMMELTAPDNSQSDARIPAEAAVAASGPTAASPSNAVAGEELAAPGDVTEAL